jgi:topoisomerase IA-like protein
MAAKKRELIEPHKGDKRYIRRDDQGRIKESDDVSRSLSQDRRRKAKTVVKPGQGDKGDRAPAKKSSSSKKTSSKKTTAKKSSAKSSSKKSASKKK